MGIRLSPYGTFNDMPDYPEMASDYAYLAAKLNELGLVYVHLVDHSPMGAPEVPVTIKQTIRKEFKRSLILSGGYDAARAEKELEEAATCLGATRWQTFTKVIFPAIAPALLTGFAMAFARAIGEYGSVIFIAGNMPMVSEITPLIIIGKLEQYDYAGATAVAVVMLLFSFALLLVINALQAWARARQGR